MTVILLIFIVAGGVFAYNSLYNNTSGSSQEEVNYDKPTSDQIEAGKEAKQKTIESSESENTSNDPKLNNSSTNSNNKSLETYITAASVEGETLYLRNEISGIYSVGTCKLTLTKGSSTVTRTAGVQPLPKSSTCRGFNIPVSSLSAGQWNIRLDVTIDDETASTDGVVDV